MSSKSEDTKKSDQRLGGIVSFVVIAVLLLLAFWPSTPTGQMPRVPNDLRTIATGLESYHRDHGAYPPPTAPIDGWPRVPNVLTTPVMYLTRIPHDHFARDKSGFGYALIGDDPERWRGSFIEGMTEPRWILLSVGLSRERGPFRLDMNMVYDPTNGSSTGYIHRFGGYDWGILEQE